MAKKVTKAAMMGFLKEMLTTNENWAKAALLRIFANQTADEQASEDTYRWNNIGFTVGDARILTSFAKFYQTRGFLTPKQLKWLMPKMGKYAGQLAKESYFDWEKMEKAYLAKHPIAG